MKIHVHLEGDHDDEGLITVMRALSGQHVSITKSVETAPVPVATDSPAPASDTSAVAPAVDTPPAPEVVKVATKDVVDVLRAYGKATGSVKNANIVIREFAGDLDGDLFADPKRPRVSEIPEQHLPALLAIAKKKLAESEELS